MASDYLFGIFTLFSSFYIDLVHFPINDGLIDYID